MQAKLATALLEPVGECGCPQNMNFAAVSRLLTADRWAVTRLDVWWNLWHHRLQTKESGSDVITFLQSLCTQPLRKVLVERNVCERWMD